MKTAVGILSWKAHETLRKTLASYEARGLRKLFDTNLIWFNARSAADDALAAEYGWQAGGTAENRGLLGGTESLARAMEGDLLLLLQNDCPLCVPQEEACAYLKAARDLLESGTADIVRCRHRWNVGEGFSDISNYLKYWPGEGAPDTLRLKLKRLFRPFKARRMIGRAPYVLREPERRHPRYIRRTGDFLIVDSAVINFTDQPYFIRRDFLLRLFDYAAAHPSHRTLNGMQVLEIILNGRWWRKRHFRIAVGTGCFTHARFDDSFRPDHPAFESRLAHAPGVAVV